MFNIAHMKHMSRDAYKSTSSISNFIFTVIMKEWVKVSSVRKQVVLFDIGRLLHLKHKYHIDATTWVLYKGLLAALVK